MAHISLLYVVMIISSKWVRKSELGGFKNVILLGQTQGSIYIPEEKQQKNGDINSNKHRLNRHGCTVALQQLVYQMIES